MGPEEFTINKNNQTQRIIFLDYLRVFAFLSVLIGHKFYTELSQYISTFSTPHITQKYLSNLFLSMFQGGGAGVVVFFMISGYIILHVLQKEKPFEFIIKRIFRIYPLLIFAIFIQVLLSFLTSHSITDLGVILSQMSLMGDFINTPYALAGVEWTLRVEIFFYILMFLLSFTIFLKNKSYILFSILAILTLSVKFISPFPTENFVGYFTSYFPFLFLGSVLYMYEKKRINLLAFLIFVFIVFYRYFKAMEDYSPHWQNSNFAIVGFSIFIILWLTRNKSQHLPNFINHYITTFALLTYSVYLFHNFLWSYISKFIGYIGMDNKFIVFLILLLWCTLVYKLIETPMNKLGKMISKKVL